MVHRFLVPLALFAALAAWVTKVTPASAFCRTTTCAVKNPPPSCGLERRDPISRCLVAGAPLYWAQGCVSFSVHSEGSAVLGIELGTLELIVASAFAKWPTTSCADGFPSIAVQNLGPIECDRREFNPTGPNANAVLFRDDGWPYDPQAIALTTVSFQRASGKILSADMEINTFGQPLSPESLQHVVMHEAGHFFGLDHSADSSAIMYERYSFSGLEAGQEPELTPDDSAGICEVYPPTRALPAACNPEPERGFASDCGGDVVGGCRAARSSPQGTRSLVGPLLYTLGLVLGGLGRRRTRIAARSNPSGG